MSFDFLSQFFNINEAYLRIMISRAGNVSSERSPYATIHKSLFQSIATVSFTTDIKLQAGDIVWVRGLQINGEGESVVWNTTFYGHLVFAE